MKGETWEFEQLFAIFKRELEASEKKSKHEWFCKHATCRRKV